MVPASGHRRAIRRNARRLDEHGGAAAAAGAAGIAVLGAIMRAANPERVARTLAGAFTAAIPGVRA